MKNKKKFTPSDNKHQTRFTYFDIFRSIWHFLDDNKKRYVFFNTVLFTILFYDLVPPLIIGKIIDFFISYNKGDSLSIFYFYIIFLGVAHIIAAFIRLGSKKRLRKIGIGAKARARILGFERLMGFSLPWHTNENSGNKVQRIFTGSQAIEGWVRLSNDELYHTVTSFVGVIVVFLFLSPIFALFSIIYTAIFLYIQISFDKKIKKLNDSLNRSLEISSGTYFEGTANILSVKAMGTAKDIHSRVRVNEETVKHLGFESTDMGVNKWYAFQTLTGIATSLFLLIIGYQVIGTKITIGMILVYYTYFKNLKNATRRASNASTRVVEIKSAMERMMPIFREDMGMEYGDKKFPIKWDNITITNSGFAYPSGQQGLKNFNLSIAKGENLGVAGQSGGGKSTLVKILLGLYKLDSGKFKMGKYNYYDIDHEKIIKNIAVVLQETELFNFSLKDNITVMRNVAPSLLELAIKVSSLDAVIEKLPDGLNTLIGEKGYFLSGGERQRLGIARAICKDAPILLLDEATSSLDSKTENKIMDRLIGELGGKKTIIIVAHRISTLRNTNRIIVIEDGSIAEEGTFSGLIKNTKSKLSQMYFLQQKKNQKRI